MEGKMKGTKKEYRSGYLSFGLSCEYSFRVPRVISPARFAHKPSPGWSLKEQHQRSPQQSDLARSGSLVKEFSDLRPWLVVFFPSDTRARGGFLLFSVLILVSSLPFPSGYQLVMGREEKTD